MSPTVRTIITDLGGPSALARKLERPMGTVFAWSSRGVLPPEVWRDLVALCKKERVFGVSYERLHELYYGEKVAS